MQKGSIYFLYVISLKMLSHLPLKTLSPQQTKNLDNLNSTAEDRFHCNCFPWLVIFSNNLLMLQKTVRH